MKINIPNSLRRINDGTFTGSLRTPIRLQDGIESIGADAFANCIFTNFRVPLLITVIPNDSGIADNVLTRASTAIGNYAFSWCFCLRNVAFPPDAVFGDDIFIDEDDDNDNEMDLQRPFECLWR
jgi:hypothetical protein